MSRKIVFSKKAASKLEKLLDYLENEWSEKIKLSFIDKLNKSLNTLTKNPKISQKSDKLDGLRRCVITKQTIVYYKYDDRKLHIVAFFDTRQDPEKLNKEI